MTGFCNERVGEAANIKKYASNAEYFHCAKYHSVSCYTTRRLSRWQCPSLDDEVNYRQR